jgi:hypothetical protein
VIGVLGTTSVGRPSSTPCRSTLQGINVSRPAGKKALGVGPTDWAICAKVA